ncbi:hypothetical protein [Niabella beijingensis]|uniref:hypothetical protein n=1 Tax=Niabella beijingensis TaxID=2872700 RepID=UPI001CC0EE8F|nr:hypothetical protein [Niabella beijingensis]MBZ4188846.1 hypothetical protein [Niabella beijingensis]
MNRSILLLTLLLTTFAAGWGQHTTASPFKRELSEPSYGLSKIKGLITREQQKQAPSFGNRPLPSGVYDSLSLPEKFTYAMIYPETYLQNCSAYPGQLFKNGKLFGRLSAGFNENTMSSRQRAFLRENRELVMKLIRQHVDESHIMGLNYKEAIVEIKGWEMIPYLIGYYNKDKNDRDLLTTLMSLMKSGAYDAFVNTTYYDQLYGKNSRYLSAIDYTDSIGQFLLKTAAAYYKKEKAGSKHNH